MLSTCCAQSWNSRTIPRWVIRDFTFVVSLRRCVILSKSRVYPELGGAQQCHQYVIGLELGNIYISMLFLFLGQKLMVEDLRFKHLSSSPLFYSLAPPRKLGNSVESQHSTTVSQLLNKMADDGPNLPPEILLMVFSYIDESEIMSLTMSCRYFAALLADKLVRDWTVSCCRDRLWGFNFQSGLPAQMGLYSFFQRLELGLAPLYAKRICFKFCTHDYHDGEVPGEEYDMPVERMATITKMVNASEITVAIRDPYPHGTVCNELLIHAILFKAATKLSDATLKFRLKKLRAHNSDEGYFYMTVRDSSMSPSTVAAKLELVKKAKEPTYFLMKKDYLWDTVELTRYVDDLVDVGGLKYSPNLRYLTIGDYDRCRNPEKFLTMYPQCQWVIAQDSLGFETQPDFDNPGSKFYFDRVADDSSFRGCTKISGHGKLCEWLEQFLQHASTLQHVQILKFHHASKVDNPGNRRPVDYTPSLLIQYMSCVLKYLPNLKTMEFKFDGNIMSDMARPELLLDGQTLATGVCSHCEMDVHIVKTDLRTLRNSLEIPENDHDARNKLYNLMFH